MVSKVRRTTAVAAAVACALLFLCVLPLSTAVSGDESVDFKETVIGKVTGRADASELYDYYRIPGMIVTSKGTLITYYEARTTGDDYADMDILAYRSTDGGDTFGDPIMLAAGSASGQTMNNPVMIPDEGNVIHLLYCVEYGACTQCGAAAKPDCPHGVGVFYRKSNDDGLTWSTPVNITASTAPETRTVIATGPGHGIKLSNGTLLVPVWMVKKEKAWTLIGHGGPAGALTLNTLYSQDGGVTWQLGEAVPYDHTTMGNPNETVAVETFDGRVMLNSRVAGATRRAVTYSDTGYSGWSQLKYDQSLIDPECFGSVGRFDARDDAEDTLLFVNCETENGRKNLTVKGSLDNGKNWTFRKRLADYDVGYADIAVGPDGTIYVLFEVSSGRMCRLARMTYDCFVADSIAALSDLSIEGAADTFTFDGKIAYTVPANNGARLSITATPYNASATVTIGGKAYTAGSTYEHTVTIGGEPLEIVVSYGSYSTTYTLNFAPKAPANSLVMHLNGESFNDATAYRNDATNTGVALNTTIKKFGNSSYYFSGQSNASYMTVGTTNCLNPGKNDFTVTTWINPTSFSDQHMIYWYGESGRPQIWSRLNGDDLQCCIGNGAGNETILTVTNAAKLNTWLHMAFVRNGNTYTVYVDGKAAASATSSVTYDLSDASAFTIGQARTTYYRTFAGYMDEFGVYNYALSVDELALLMQKNTVKAEDKGGTVTFAVNGVSCGETLSAEEGDIVTVTATPSKGMLLRPGSLVYKTADGKIVKILNKELNNVNVGSGNGNTFEFVMPKGTVEVTAEFVSAATDSFAFDTIGTSYHKTGDTYDGIRFLTRINFGTFDTSADELTVTYGGKTYTVTQIGMLLKRSSNTAELALGSANVQNAVCYNGKRLTIADYTASYIDIQVCMMQSGADNAAFRARQFTARGYMVLEDADGTQTVLYSPSTITHCVNDMVPPTGGLKPEFGSIELQ